MSTITREFTTEKLIAIIAAVDDLNEALEEVRKSDLINGKVVARWDFLNDHAPPSEVVKRLAEIALASLEAEPMAFRSKLKPPSAIGSERWDYTDHRQPDAFELENCVIERLFIAQPVPEVLERLRYIVADPRALPRRKEWISGQQ
ncbi:hypothetical protein F3J30_01815 [Enterobacter sp. Tr-810]|uniref:hypothetical protein n=1 Tax=Enterobacter sp. Tr-810 TaxID=2608347 RepID=UPI001419177C|nr:hypothetical protein [Enterobacter sp. Tr-810]NIF35275.1 hypothetical protein [Enterobacter sp. Tr-810]